MPVYHSAYNGADTAEICGCPILPLKTKVRGPAPCVDAAAMPDDDIVDEAIKLFRANVLFKSFEPQGSADRLLVYLLLFVHQCLKKVAGKPNKTEALRELSALAQGQHFIPGDPGWPLGTLLPAPKTAAEGESLRAYYRQLREVLVGRLADRIYDATGAPNKHWMMFAKRKFLNKEFP